MANEIFRKDEFAISVITKGGFFDNDPGFNGKQYKVDTYVIRLNHIALNEWIMSEANNWPECYETREEYDAYLAEKKAQREALERKIAAAVGIVPGLGGVTITKNVSEIFTVVHIYEF